MYPIRYVTMPRQISRLPPMRGPHLANQGPPARYPSYRASPSRVHPAQIDLGRPPSKQPDLSNSGSLSRASVCGCAYLPSPVHDRRAIAVASVRRDELEGLSVVIVADLGVHAVPYDVPVRDIDTGRGIPDTPSPGRAYCGLGEQARAKGCPLPARPRIERWCATSEVIGVWHFRRRPTVAASVIRPARAAVETRASCRGWSRQ
jgi:hypothetical protein